MKTTPPVISRRSVQLTAFVLTFVTTAAIACQVPVFRYALERWPADNYEVIVLHDGPLNAESENRVKDLRKSAATGANFEIEAIDIGKAQDELLKRLWKQHGEGGEPVMAVLYPRNAQEVPDRVADVSPFTDEAIARLADSPVRQELVKKLLEGDSAVWIFVPSGHADQDEVARKLLIEQVKRNAEELELPPQEEIEEDEFFLPETEIELRIGFSVVTLRRDDPKEAFLLRSLLGSEPDLEELDQPMAFPVLGRGRVLYALVGKGIFADTIGMASRFIVGPCSCQVKDQNPGFDLLLSVDWDEKLGGSKISKPLKSTSSEPLLLTIPPGKSNR